MGDPNSYSTLNSRIPIIRTPQRGTPNFRKPPFKLWRYRTSTSTEKLSFFTDVVQFMTVLNR